MQYTPAIETAISDMMSLGPKAAAGLLLAAAPAVKAPLSETWEQLLRAGCGMPLVQVGCRRRFPVSVQPPL